MVTASSLDRAALERHFVSRGSKGQRVVSDNVTTNIGHISLARLHSLARKGLVTYDDEPYLKQMFGVIGWRLRLTETGRSILQEAPSWG